MTFKPGVSGNPSGRKALDPVLKARIKELGERALERLALLAESADEDVALQASKYLADRHLGKAPQAVELSGEDGGPIIAVIRDA